MRLLLLQCAVLGLVQVARVASYALRCDEPECQRLNQKDLIEQNGDDDYPLDPEDGTKAYAFYLLGDPTQKELKVAFEVAPFTEVVRTKYLFKHSMVAGTVTEVYPAVEDETILTFTYRLDKIDETMSKVEAKKVSETKEHECMYPEVDQSVKRSRVASKRRCQYKCKKNKACEWSVHDEIKKTCALKTRTSGVSIKNFHDSCKTGGSTKKCIMRRSDYSTAKDSKALARTIHADSRKKCSLECKKSEVCLHWQWNKGQRECQLFEKVGGEPTKNPAIISGGITCPTCKETGIPWMTPESSKSGSSPNRYSYDASFTMASKVLPNEKDLEEETVTQGLYLGGLTIKITRHGTNFHGSLKTDSKINSLPHLAPCRALYMAASFTTSDK